ncbi:MAG: phage portal protein [Sphingobacteriaceae bacterium]|nr:phage portal protein [Sphingobacteriaceae bacterium]
MTDSLFKGGIFDTIIDYVEENGSLPSYNDYYGNTLTPGPIGLVKQYKDIVYACANINANAVALKSLKLYVTTDKTQAETVLKKAPLENKEEKRVREQYKIRQNVQLEEVIDHPVLDLFSKPLGNSALLNEYKLFNFTQLYQEITGAAYWWIISHPVLNIPARIWLFPTHHLSPVSEAGDSKPISYYQYNGPDEKLRNRKFSVNEIIPFLSPNLYDPYASGYSPGLAAYSNSLVLDKLMSMTTKFLDNQARPDIVVMPKEAIGSEIAERWERSLNLKFKYGRNGGYYVLDEPANIEILNFKPNDYARLDLQKNNKNNICNIFGVPIALIDSEAISEKTLEAALKQHAMQAVAPRLRANTDLLNVTLLPYYDQSGRLFLGYEDPVPENREEKLQENVQLVMNGIKTPNEARKDYNLPPREDGDILRSINVAGSGSFQREDQRKSGVAEK